jgi:GntR family transcriptional repressor for pyruvate dehydrogenase complex
MSVPPPYAGRAIRGRGRITDEIIEVLREDIATGRVQRGTRLPNERELARHFGVSQSTVREAIRALTAMGLIDVRHGSGSYVREDSGAIVASSLRTLLQIERVEILDLLDVRAVLGRYSVVQAAERATDADIAAIREAAERIDADTKRSGEELKAQIVNFHLSLSASCRNPLLHSLEAFLIRVLMQFQLFDEPRGLAAWKRRSLRFAADRRSIVDAVAERSQDRALEAMDAYLADQREIFASDPEFSNLRLSDPKAIRTLADWDLNTP